MAGIRIGGLASGMDIDSIVEKLMTAERIPLDKLTQKKTTTEWQRDSYRAVNTKLKAFDDYLSDNFLLSSSFNLKKVASTNEGAVTATGKSEGNVTINKIDQLASAAYGVGTIADASKRSKTTTMADLGVADQTVKLNVLQADGTMKETSFNFKATDKISDVVTKINGSNAGVSAFYDEKTGQMSLSAKASGENKSGGEIEVTDGSTFFQTGFGFTSNVLADNGKNAKLTLNGAEIERNSNTFTELGMTFTLKATSTTNTTLTSTTDVDGMVDKVKEFVEKYNDVISGMNGQLKEKKYRDFPPLTEEQRKDMSEEEQKLWDEKAKSGLLRSDSIVSNGLSGMRNSIYGRVGNESNIIDTLAEIGITTSSAYSDGGKLVIDEDKLRKALTENPDQVVKTITNPGEKTNVEDTRGIVQRLRASITDFTRSIEAKAGKVTVTDQQYTMGKSLIDMNERISKFQRRLEDVEARYWKQFTAMESAINKANSQSSYLSQFGAS